MTRKISKDRVLWGAPSFWINVFPLYFGRNKGFFQHEGIDLKVKYFHGGPQVAGAISRGKVRIGNMGLPPFSTAFDNGLRARIIGSSIIRTLDIFLVSQPEIKNMDDLRGKKIGVLSLGSCDNYFIDYMLKKESIDPAKEVEILPMGSSYGDLKRFALREVDATFLVEPNVTLGESKNVLNILACVADYFPRYQWNVIFAREDLLEEDGGLVRRILGAYRKSARCISENIEESVVFGSQLFKIKKDVFRKAVEKSLPRWETEAQIDVKGLDNAIKIQKQIGALRPDFKKDKMLWQL